MKHHDSYNFPRVVTNQVGAKRREEKYFQKKLLMFRYSYGAPKVTFVTLFLIRKNERTIPKHVIIFRDYGMYLVKTLNYS